MESSCKIQFNSYDKNIACDICYMSHVTHVTCHKSKVANNFTKDPVCYIFMENSFKIQYNGHDKSIVYNVLHVTCHTCYMSQI